MVCVAEEKLKELSSSDQHKPCDGAVPDWGHGAGCASWYSCCDVRMADVPGGCVDSLNGGDRKQVTLTHRKVAWVCSREPCLRLCEKFAG
jgi:hypothetical protein